MMNLNDLETKPLKNVTAHELVSEVCVSIANEMYEEYARHNEWYAANPSRQRYVQETAPGCIKLAIALLGHLLSDPDTSETEKQKIYEALILNNELPRGGVSYVKKGTWH